MSRERIVIIATITGLFVWLFADALFRSGMFVFRDAGHFYYPLFRFCADEWAAGRMPLWNPFENLGQPLAADPTASVFYPGKLIFALPIGYAWAYKTYIMAHLLLAAYAAYRLARHWKASVEAAGVCAISYAFSGNLLFNYCNVVFLVGAAWLPAAVLAADRMLAQGAGGRDQGSGARGQGSGEKGGRGRWAVVLGGALGLMVLGGDPQMAYNAGLLAALYALWLWWDEDSLSLWERVRVRVKRGSISGRRLLRSRLGLLALAAAIAFVLSAVQVLPSMELVGHSTRAADRTVREVLLARPEPGTHQEHVYQFSVGPWRLAEYLWPNVSGRQFPVHRRWLNVIPAEGRVWTPSLYMGLLPLLLAVSAMRFRRRSTRRGDKPRGSPAAERSEPRGSSPRVCETRLKWLSWMVVLAVVAGFGWYGLGWLIEEVRLAAGGDPASPGPLGGPFGGLYWLMSVLLPGYGYFRYPAKLMVVAALGLSVLAAWGWDRTFAGPSVRFRRGLLWLGGVSVCGVVVTLSIRPFWDGWLSHVEPDKLFGPLDTAGAANDLLMAFVQTAVVCGLFWWLFRRAASGVRWAGPVALLLIAVDLAVANRWMVVCAPADEWEQPSKLAAVLQREEQGDGQPYRVFRHPIWTPRQWERAGSRARLEEAMQWDRDTLWPKYNLASGISLAEVEGAIMLHDYGLFLRQPGGAGRLAKYVILPGDQNLPGGRRLSVDVADVSLWCNPKHLPRAWIADRVDVRAPGGDSCRVTHCDPLRVEIEAELARPGLVVLADQCYPGWRLEVETAGQPPRSVPILRTNRVMRGVRLPAGEHRLIYRYRPTTFFWGATISGLGWIGLVISGIGVGLVAASRRVYAAAVRPKSRGSCRCAPASWASPGPR